MNLNTQNSEAAPRLKQAIGFGQNCVDPARYGGWDGWLAGCCNDTAADLACAALRGCACTAELSSADGAQPPQRRLGNATVAAFDAALRAAAALQPGDLCVIQNSGHGGRVENSAGCSEFLCFYDGVYWDRQLYARLAAIPAGVQLVLLLDACHSGGMDRGLSLQPRRAMTSRVVEELLARGVLNPPAAGSAAGPIRAQVLLFAACTPEQTALDGARNGAWTGARHAVLRQFHEAGKIPTYQEWADATYAYMNQHFPGQTPVLTPLGQGNELLHNPVFA